MFPMTPSLQVDDVHQVDDITSGSCCPANTRTARLFNFFTTITKLWDTSILIEEKALQQEFLFGTIDTFRMGRRSGSHMAFVLVDTTSPLNFLALLQLQSTTNSSPISLKRSAIKVNRPTPSASWYQQWRLIDRLHQHLEISKSTDLTSF